MSVWAPAIDRKFVINPLNTIQRRFALRISKAYRTVSTNAANIISDLMPIDLYLKGKAVQYFANNHIACDLTDFYFEGTSITVHDIQTRIDVRQLPHYGLKKPLNSLQTLSDTESYYYVYIDGRSSDRNIASAFVINHSNLTITTKKIKMSKHCTGFQAKLLAIKRALVWLKTWNRQKHHIIVNICDKSVFRALHDYNSINLLIHNIYKLFYELMSNSIDVFINEVDFRSEIQLKTRDLAKAAIDSHNCIEYNLIPKSVLKHTIREKNIDIWSERWAQSTTGSQTKHYFPTVRDRIAAKSYTPDYYTTQMVTNHGEFA